MKIEINCKCGTSLVLDFSTHIFEFFNLAEKFVEEHKKCLECKEEIPDKKFKESIKLTCPHCGNVMDTHDIELNSSSTWVCNNCMLDFVSKNIML